MEKIQNEIEELISYVKVSQEIAVLQVRQGIILNSISKRMEKELGEAFEKDLKVLTSLKN